MDTLIVRNRLSVYNDCLVINYKKAAGDTSAKILLVNDNE